MVPLSLSYSDARQNLAKIIKTCSDDYQPVIIKSRDRQVVMIPLDQYESWLETMHQLDSPANVRHLEQSMAEMERGEYVSVSADKLDDYLFAAEDET